MSEIDNLHRQAQHISDELDATMVGSRALVSIAESLSYLSELIEAIDGVRLALQRIADVQEEEDDNA